MQFLIADPLAEVDPVTTGVREHCGPNGKPLPLWVDDLIVLGQAPVFALFELMARLKRRHG